MTLSQLFRRSTTEKQRIRPHGHPGNAYLVVWKVGVTRTYVNENEEQPGDLAGRILKNNTIERLQNSCIVFMHG